MTVSRKAALEMAYTVACNIHGRLIISNPDCQYRYDQLMCAAGIKVDVLWQEKLYGWVYYFSDLCEWNPSYLVDRMWNKLVRDMLAYGVVLEPAADTDT